MKHSTCVAIFVNLSTDENFLLLQSKKVKLFGHTTFGAFDMSNVVTINSPDKMFSLAYCLTKSIRIPGFQIDEIGIQPDYFIDQTISNTEWVNFVASILEKNSL